MSFIPAGQPLISTVNSTSTPLSGGATFTGTWEEVWTYGSVTVSGLTDVACTMYVDFSTDGTNADSTIQSNSGIDGSLGFVAAIELRRYMRVRIVNGAAAQAYLRVQTIYGPARVALATSRVSQTATDYSPAVSVRLLSDVYLDEASGRQQDRATGHKFGSNSSVSTSEVVIWSTGTAYTGFLTTASTVRIKSGGNVNDTAAGTGARSVTVVGLDASWVETTEVIVTAGASASSATAASFIRVYRAYVTGSGTYSAGVDGANAGDIVIETSGGVTLATIAATLGQTQVAAYTVPSGYSAYIRTLSVSVDGSKAATVRLFQRANADTVAAPFTGRRLVSVLPGLTGFTQRDFTSYLGPFAAKTDLWATGQTATGTTSVSVSFDYILVRT